MSTILLRTAVAAMVVLFEVAGVSLAWGMPADAPARAQDHAGHEGSQEKPEPAATAPQDHSAHQPPGQGQTPPVPPVTDEDRAAAFPELNGQHAVHDDALHYYVLFDQLEWQTGGGFSARSWDTTGWFGKDVNRFWFRTEGAAEDDGLAKAQAHALFGRAIHRWWDVVVGVRQDFRPGPQRTWAAVGIQGLAPYWFEVQATAYLGEGGRTQFRVETEYELLFTNRLILQPLVELELHGKSDPERTIGAGLSSVETGLRLRYELRRELAPYVGVTWNRKFFGTGDFAEAAGADRGTARLALGVRVWF